MSFFKNKLQERESMLKEINFEIPNSRNKRIQDIPKCENLRLKEMVLEINAEQNESSSETNFASATPVTNPKLKINNL